MCPLWLHIIEFSNQNGTSLVAKNRNFSFTMCSWLGVWGQQKWKSKQYYRMHICRGDIMHHGSSGFAVLVVIQETTTLNMPVFMPSSGVKRSARLRSSSHVPIRGMNITSKGSHVMEKSTSHTYLRVEFLRIMLYVDLIVAIFYSSPIPERIPSYINIKYYMKRHSVILINLACVTLRYGCRYRKEGGDTSNKT